MTVRPSDNLPAYIASRLSEAPAFAYLAATMPIRDALTLAAFNEALYARLKGSERKAPLSHAEIRYQINLAGWRARKAFWVVAEGVLSLTKGRQPELATEGANGGGGMPGSTRSETRMHPRPERPTNQEGDAFLDRETVNDAAIRNAIDEIEREPGAQVVANQAAEIVRRRREEAGDVNVNININIQGDAHFNATVETVSNEVRQLPGLAGLSAKARDSIAVVAGALAIWAYLSNPTQPATMDPAREYPAATVTASSGLNLRPTAGQDYPAIITLKKGTVVRVIDDGPNWSYVQAHDPERGKVLFGHVCGLWLSNAAGDEDCDR